jgi:RNA polymerase sigma-70 factor (ECF subfamily)
MALTREEIIRGLLAARTRIVAAAWLIVRDAHAAEDIFQTVTVKTLESGADFERDAALISWAFVSARHLALNWVRDQRQRAVVLHSDALDILDAEWAKEPSGSCRDRVEALELCLGELPGDARLLELRYYDQKSCAEVGAALSLGLDVVYQRISRLHRALRQCVERRLSAPNGQLSRGSS